TTVAAGDVTIDNSGASATTLGSTEVGGNYTITATNEPITQAAGTAIQVQGNLTATGSSILLTGAANLVGGTTSLPATSTTELVQAGVITLPSENVTGNLTVISQATSRSFSGSAVSGSAILLDDAGNSIGGTISTSASPPTVTNNGYVQTGIQQATSTTISVSGTASFTAESSSAGTLGVQLTNGGNSFGTLVLSGDTVAVNNSAVGVTTIGSASAGTSLTLTAAAAVAQTGAISTPSLTVDTTGAVTLNNADNDIGSIDVTSGGGAVSVANAGSLSVDGVDAGGSTVNLQAGGTGDLTQTGALRSVSTLTVDAGGGVVLTNSGNSIQSLAASQAGTALQLYNGGGALSITGPVSTATGDLLLRTTGDLTVATGGVLDAAHGNVVVSTEGDGNFINDSSQAGSALVVGSGDRWLVYSDTPDLVSGAHTVKGGLTSDFRHYGNATYTSYAPASVTESGDGFIYDYATPALTVNAAINGTPSQVYGDNPTATLGYTISSGLVDSEDSASNVVTGGTPTYSMALSDTLSAG
ncbi:MAG: beta strand repeat-containing protein, partial [Steroidobacteraceae bacterium]